jgi:putative nucleotidyltransferase with HDIG domain
VDGIEVATFRTDKYFGLSDKNVEISVAKTIGEDLSRRDLTINAMAICQHTGEIIDRFGGKEDLRHKIIRFVGNPEKRIYEDPNRIIRACRFLALIEGTFDEGTKEALKKYSYFIKEYVDVERIRLEILKSMNYRKPSIFFLALHEIDALKYIFPTLDRCFDHDHGPYHDEDIFSHSMMCGDNISKKYPLLRLGGYLHDIGKVITACQDIETREFHFAGHEKVGAVVVREELEHLKFSNDDVNYVSFISELHMRNFDSPKTIRRTFKALADYEINYKDIIRLKLADRKANLKRGRMNLSEARELISDIRNELTREPPNDFKHLKLDGNDIMKITGIPQGKIIGDILKFLLQNVVDVPELNNVYNLKQLVFEYITKYENPIHKLF